MISSKFTILKTPPKSNKEVAELSLKERKKKLKDTLTQKEKMNFEELIKLLPYDNTNEDLLFKYIEALSDEKYENEDNYINNCYNALKEYANYISVQNLKKLAIKIYNKEDRAYRKISFKKIFFNFLFDLNKPNADLSKSIAILKNAILSKEINNQPFSDENFEALYFYICTKLVIQIHINEPKREQYFDNLKNLINALDELKVYFKDNEMIESYEEEKKDFNKFIIIISAIINLDADNYDEIIKIAIIFKSPTSEIINSGLTYIKPNIKKKYGEEAANEFIDKIKNSNNFHSIDYERIDNKIRLKEECYLYDYIKENNIYMKHKDKIKSLLNIILKSDLIKQLIKTIFQKDGVDAEKIYKFIFEKDYTIDDIMDEIILFTPYRLDRISGFHFRDLFKIFIPI